METILSLSKYLTTLQSDDAASSPTTQTSNIISLTSTSIHLNPNLNNLAASITGLSISTFIFVIASWRLLVHYSGWLIKCGCIQSSSTTTNINNSGTNVGNVYIRSEGLTTKRILHILLWSAMLIEGIAYIDMLIVGSSNQVNYLCLDILGRGIFEYTTFGILTVYWFHMTSAARAIDREKDVMFTLFPVLLGLVTVCMIGVNTLEAVVLLRNTEGYTSLSEFRSESSIHRITLLIECICWGIHAIIVSICGGMVYRRISSLPNFAALGSKAKHRIYNKMLFPIVCCALSYALRAGWYGADYVSRIQDPNTTFETGAGWWIGNVWIPTLIPSLCLLYSVRKRDREPGSIDGVSESLLKGDYLMSGKNNDPFRNFNRVFRDLDDESAIVSVE
ncbi:hypothetical protein ACHAWO_007921 [Cyclotella atomus]|uniref:Transmembrane protein n=1 Tax=Cyclotella atomus TaxID=382360 RepID=A0ABD3MVP6_9STRA